MDEQTGGRRRRQKNSAPEPSAPAAVFHGSGVPFGSASHGGTHLSPAGRAPHSASWNPSPFSMALPTYSFGQLETSDPYSDLPSPAGCKQPRPVLDHPSPTDVNKRRRRNNASGSLSNPPSLKRTFAVDKPSIAPPPHKRTFSVDIRSTLSDPDDSQFGSEPEHNTATRGQQLFVLSEETMTYMERMRSTVEDYMKAVCKVDFESSELRPIYTKAFKNRCFTAIERGDFVPLESFMCSTGEKSLREKTLPQALMERRTSRQRPSCKAIANGQSLFTRDFANNVSKDASHLCHQKLYDLFWHVLGELGADNIGRNKCIQLLAKALDKGEPFPLDRCWCGNTPHCLLGPAALTDEEVVTYQWMAANNYASFSEIPIENMHGMKDLDDESLGSVFTTWKVELRDNAGLKSAWAVPVVSKTLKELYEERLYDAARQHGLLPDNQSEATDDDDLPERALSLKSINRSLSTANREKLNSAPRSQMAILLPENQILDIFKRFKRNEAGLQRMATKFIAATSYFSKLRVLARIAYNDQLATVKEATKENVLDNQQRTLTSLRQGIKARTAASIAEREQLIIWDIENRVAVFMLVVAEESGGNLPDDFEQWAEDSGGQQQSPRGEKRKRADIYAAVSKTLMSENPSWSSSFKPGNIKEMATQGRVLYSLLRPYGRRWSTVLPLADFCGQVDSSVHNSVLKVQPYLWKTLQICLEMTEDLNAMLKDICRDPDAWKTRHPADMADARAAYYRPGSDPAWGFGVDNGRLNCRWYVQPGDNGRLRIDYRDAISVVRKLEPADALQLDYSISTWVAAMKIICSKQIEVLGIKRTPEHRKNEYWVFEWLETCASTRDLSEDQKIANQHRWTKSSNASVAVIEDTPGSCLALAIFESGGKIDKANTVHVIAHFSPLVMEYADRAKHWAAIISRLFPADYPVLAPDVQIHSRVSNRIPAQTKDRLLHSGLMTVMDFVYLSIAGEQYPVNEQPDYNLCLRALLSEVAGMAARARRRELGSTEWDEGGQQQPE